MAYHGVNRVITIHWHEGWRRGEYTVEVLPDPAQAYLGDSITWVVMGHRVPAGISVANFDPIMPPPRVRLKGKLVSLLGPRGLKGKKLKIQADPKHGGYKITLDVTGIQPGWYKYDVVISNDHGGAEVLLDPELEVKDPPAS